MAGLPVGESRIKGRRIVIRKRPKFDSSQAAILNFQHRYSRKAPNAKTSPNANSSYLASRLEPSLHRLNWFAALTYRADNDGYVSAAQASDACAAPLNFSDWWREICSH